ncbi:phosphoribosyl-AMP cyclohydrolase [Saccharospirillum sp. MSK14-1]|uniref:phosphoribosyl-AMP cyclohydrolase n=1 Tax=Saccharospirillum sp. MSK14-1 TaxID=1897632 RepID=UPI000D3A2873|nr:phosphoribosyl-AMP cyclohydrolase [Saccharospirillum sp. MSK14-1]PTY36984.1 phosphoribosyl-AMP cyclohydrolase [Saccharospirillum sp. MSK14-1]
MFKEWEAASAGTTLSLTEVLDQLRYNDDGLVPAIAQQHDSGEVLMLAWMNRDSIIESLQTGQVCYWSRSRQTYWRKGESSGHRQRLRELRIDCDGDALLLLVDQQGPACHTDRRDCFYISLDAQGARILTDPASGR